jgi:DNA repair exonuclease SbcCD ATPase subunit
MPNDKMYKLGVGVDKKSLEKIKKDLVDTIKPFEEAMRNVESKGLTAGNKSKVKAELTSLFKLTEKQANALQDMVNGVVPSDDKQLNNLKQNVQNLVTFMSDAMQRMAKLGESTDWMKSGVSFVDAFTHMKSTLATTEGTVRELKASISDLTESFNVFKEAFATVNPDAFAKRFSDNVITKIESRLKNAKKSLDKLIKDGDVMPSDYSDYSTDSLNEEYKELVNTLSQLDEKMNATKSGTKEYKKYLMQAADTLADIHEINKLLGKDTSQGLGNVTADVVATIKQAGEDFKNTIKSLKLDNIQLSVELPDASATEFTSKINEFVNKANEQFKSKPISVSLDITNPFKDIDVKEFSKKQQEITDRTKNTAKDALKGISGTDGDNSDLSILDDPEVGKILRKLYESFEKIKKGVVSGQKSITDATKEWRKEIDEQLKLKFTWETSSNADQIQQMFDIIQDMAEDNPIHLFADTVSFIDDIQDALKDVRISINADINDATIKSFNVPSDDVKKEFKSFKQEPVKPSSEDSQDSNELSKNSNALNTATKSSNSLVEALNKLNTSITNTEQKKTRAQTRKTEIESVAKQNVSTIKDKERLVEENDKKIAPLKKTQAKMQSEVDAIRKEIADIEKQRDNRADIKKLSSERDELRSKNRDGQFNDKIRELTAQIEQISEPYNAKIEEITSIKLTPAIKALGDINTKISNLNDANTALVNEIAKLKQTSELENQDKAIKNAAKDLPKLTRRRDAVQSVIDDNKDITALVLEPLDSFYKKVEETKEKADGINENLTAKKQELSDVQDELQKLDADTNKDAAEALKAKIVKLKSDITELTTELESANKSFDTADVRKRLLEQKGFKDVRGLTEDERIAFVTNLLKQSTTLADELQNTSMRVDGSDVKLSIQSLQDLIYFIPEVQKTLGIVAQSSDQWASEKGLQEKFINIFKLANQLKALGNISVKNDVAPTAEAIQEFIGVFEHVPVMAKVIEAAKEYLEKAIALSNNTDPEKIESLTSEKDIALHALMGTINGKRKDENIDGKQVSTYVPGAKAIIKEMLSGQEPLHVKVVGTSGTEKTYGLKRTSRDANLDVTGRNYTFANAGRAAKRLGIDSLLEERFEIEATFGTLDAMRTERASIIKELKDISKQDEDVTEAEKVALQTKKQELIARLEFIKTADTRIGEIDDEIAKKVKISTKKNAPIRTSRKSYEYGGTEFVALQKERQEKVRQLESLNAQEETESIKRSKELIQTRLDEIDSLLSLGNAQGIVIDGIRALNNDVAISTAKVDEAKRAVKAYDKELKNGFTENEKGRAWAYDKIQREHKNAVVGRFGKTYFNDYTKTADMNQERWADFKYRLTTAKENKTMNVDVISDIENMLKLRDSAMQELDSMTESQKKTGEGAKRVEELKKILLENSRDAILKKYYDTEGWYLNDLLSQRLKNIDLEFEQSKNAIQSGNSSAQSVYASQIEEENRRYAQELSALHQKHAVASATYNLDEQSIVNAYLQKNDEAFSSAFVPILGKLLSQRDKETEGLSESSNEYKNIQQKYVQLIDDERAKLKASFLTPIEEYRQLLNNLPNPDDLVKQRKTEIEKELSDSFASEVQSRGLKLGTDEYKALENEYFVKANVKYAEAETSYRSSVSNEIQRKKEEIETKLRNFIVELVENHKKQLIDNFNVNRGDGAKVKSLEEIQTILSEAVDVAIKNAAKVHADNLAKILPEDVKTDEQIQEAIDKKAAERDAAKAQAVSKVMVGSKYISDMDLMRQETEKQRDAAQKVYDAEKEVLANKQAQVNSLKKEHGVTDEMLQYSEAVAQTQQEQTLAKQDAVSNLQRQTSGRDESGGGYYYGGGYVDTSNLAQESTLRGIYQLLNGGPPEGGWDSAMASGIKDELDLSVKSFSSKLNTFAGGVVTAANAIRNLPDEHMVVFGDSGRVDEYLSGKENEISSNQIKNFLNKHKDQNLQLALHNHPDGIAALTPQDIQSVINMKKLSGLGALGSIAGSKITGIDISDVNESTSKKLLDKYKANIRNSIFAEIFDDDFNIKEEFANSPSLDKQKLSEKLNGLLQNAITSVGLSVDETYGQIDVSQLDEASKKVANSVIEAGAKTAVESSKQITKDDIKSKQTAFQEKFKTKNAETGKTEYPIQSASLIDQAFYNVGDRLTKDTLTDGDLTKLTKAYDQLENAFKKEIIQHLDQETIDFLNALRGQISTVLDANTSQISAKEQQSKAIAEAKKYLSELKTEEGKRVKGASRAKTGIEQIYGVLDKGKVSLSKKDLTALSQGYDRLQQTVSHAVYEKLDENTKTVINDAIQNAKTMLDKHGVVSHGDDITKKQAQEIATTEAAITQEKQKQNKLATEAAQKEEKAAAAVQERASAEQKTTETKKKAKTTPKAQPSSSGATTSSNSGNTQGGLIGILSRIATEETLSSIAALLSKGVKTTSGEGGSGGRSKSNENAVTDQKDAETKLKAYLNEHYKGAGYVAGAVNKTSTGYSINASRQRDNAEEIKEAEKAIAECTIGTEEWHNATKRLALLQAEQENIVVRINSETGKITATTSFKNLAIGAKAATKELRNIDDIMYRLQSSGALTFDGDGNMMSSNASVTKFLSSVSALNAFTEGKTQEQLFDPANNAILSNLTLAVQTYRKEIVALLNAVDQYNTGDSKGILAGIVGTDDSSIKRAMQDAISANSDLVTSFGSLTPVMKNGQVVSYQLAYTLKTGKREVQEMTASLNPLTHELTVQKGEVKEVATGWDKFWSGLKSKMASIMQYIVSITSIQDIFRYIREGVQYVREIDSALTELKKVTDETDASYRNFLQDMSKTGAVIGATVKDLTTMAAEWARLGYSIEDAGKLAESTAILLNVSEFDDATEASEALISTMQAFSYTADESQHVVDILNEVGNNYAVSSDGIATALQDSASALMEGGNNLEQAVALVAAANRVVQDPNSVGSALRTISLRLRGTSVKV